MQPDGGRALAVGKLDAVPEAAGGRALRIVVCDARITALPVQWGAEPVLARVSKDLEASAVFPQAQLFSIFSLAYYPRQRCGAYRARSKVV